MIFDVADQYISYGTPSQFNFSKPYFEDQALDNVSILDKRESDQLVKPFDLQSQEKNPTLNFLGSSSISTNDSFFPQQDLMSCQTYDDDINSKFDQEGPEETETSFTEKTTQAIHTYLTDVAPMVRKDSNQSIFKNKYKEEIEKADTIFRELTELEWSKYLQTLHELQKSDMEWVKEGKKLVGVVEDYEKIEKILEKEQEEAENLNSEIKRKKTIDKEIEKAERKLKEMERQYPKEASKKKKRQQKIDQAKQELEKLRKEKILLGQRDCLAEVQLETKKAKLKKLLEELEKPRNILLEALKSKKYGIFAHICRYKDQIQSYVSKKASAEYFEAYKKKRSMKYFEDFEIFMKEEEVFYWILVLGIVRLMTPKDEGDLKLLPLRKDKILFMSWMIESNVMKVKHKTLFKTSKVRIHLVDEFTRIYNILTTAAKKKVDNGTWTQEKWDLLERIFEDVGGTSSIICTRNSTEETFGVTDSDTNMQTGKRSFAEINNEFNLSEMEIEELEDKIEKRVFLGYW